MKNRKLKILLAAAEATPIAKVGGLGDVIGALPKALAELGADARIIMPFYGAIDRKKFAIKKISASLWRTFLPQTKITVYLLKHKLFNGKKIYGTAPGDGESDFKKFFCFSRAILTSLKAISFQPDVIHLNDWHTAAVAGLIKNRRLNIKTVFTIHNLANQGISRKENRNLMAEGILNSDLITTVSPTYAREILTPEYGSGLEKVLSKRKNNLDGILNGLDTDFFNPATDKLIKQNYSAAAINKKIKNKLILQKKLGLPAKKEIAVVGLVTRFVQQKGLNLITEKFARLNCQFVLLGAGEKKYENALTCLAKKYPDKFSVKIKFDEPLAHQIYAASDIFLVPSRFEPCGLTQLIAMRYGSVPVARAVGGLKDTVNSQVGFTFKKFNSVEFYKTLARALKVYYRQPKTWRRLQLNGLEKDFSWKKSAKQYLRLYQKLCH